MSDSVGRSPEGLMLGGLGTLGCAVEPERLVGALKTDGGLDGWLKLGRLGALKLGTLGAL